MKQQIPVEAVYAYIEAKHTLTVEGEGAQSLHKAGRQVAAVKSLPREPITVKNAFNPYIDFGGLRPVSRDNYPKILNPLFGAIIARQVRIKERNKPLKTGEQIIQALDGKSVEADLLIAGSDVVFLPFINHDKQGTQVYHSPFAISESELVCRNETPGLAIAICISSLFYALDQIILGHVKWLDVIADSLKIDFE